MSWEYNPDDVTCAWCQSDLEETHSEHGFWENDRDESEIPDWLTRGFCCPECLNEATEKGNWDE